MGIFPVNSMVFCIFWSYLCHDQLIVEVVVFPIVIVVRTLEPAQLLEIFTSVNKKAFQLNTDRPLTA